MQVWLAEIQKNISILSNINDVLTIVDKRKKKSIARIYPIKKNNISKRLSWFFFNDVKESKKWKSIYEIREELDKIKLKELWQK